MDIDADFCIYNGYKVFDYLNEKYGKNHCCNIITFQRLQTKAVIKDLARALGADFKEVNKFTTTIPDEIDGHPVHVKDLINHPHFKWFFDKYPTIKKHAIKLEGLPKSTSQHPAGIGVVPQEITDLTPVIKAKDNTGNTETYLSQFEKNQCEEIGIVKYDVLKLATISMTREMVKMVNKLYDLNLTEDKIPLNDKKTWDMISNGDTLGVFQFESPVGINIVKKIKPQNIEELSAANAFVRPGSSGLENYLKGKDNSEFIKKFDPRLDKYLKPTFGAIVYQEQIMEMISELMGLSFGQADIYRRALEKPDKPKNAKLVEKFNNNVVEKAKLLGYSKKVANEVRQLIIDNSAYGFNKCLSGDEKIFRDKNQHFHPTIEEMYLIKNDENYAKINNKMALREKYNINGYGTTLSMNENGRLVRNKIIDITFSGVKKVYLVETETGETVKCTMNHKFPTPNGEKLLSELKVGDELYVKDENYSTKASKIKYITYLKEENTYNIEMDNPYHNLLMNNGIIVCNSHSICYSVISYWTAWFKVNYPLVFYMVMLNFCDDNDFRLFLGGAKKAKINIKPPNINKSRFLCTIEDEETIRIGLKSIKGIGPATVECIERLQPFSSLDEFFKVKTSSVNKRAIEAFANIGAFVGLGIEVEPNDVTGFEYLLKDNKLYLNNEQMRVFFEKYFALLESKSMPNYAIPSNLIKGKALNDFDLVIESDINGVVIPEDKLELFEIELTEDEKLLYKTKKRPKGSLKPIQINSNTSIFRQIINSYKDEIFNAKVNVIEKYINEIDTLGYSLVEHPCQKFIDKIYNKTDPKSTFESMKDNSMFMTCGVITELEEKVSKNNNKYYLVHLNTPVDNVLLQLWENQLNCYRNIIKKNNIIKVLGTKGFGRIQVSKIELIK